MLSIAEKYLLFSKHLEDSEAKEYYVKKTSKDLVKGVVGSIADSEILKETSKGKYK